MRYKVGDAVVIRKDLHADRAYYMDDIVHCDDCTKEMVEFGGRVCVVEESRNHGYRLQGAGPYNWTDEMFEEKSFNLKGGTSCSQS